MAFAAAALAENSTIAPLGKVATEASAPSTPSIMCCDKVLRRSTGIRWLEPVLHAGHLSRFYAKAARPDHWLAAEFLVLRSIPTTRPYSKSRWCKVCPQQDHPGSNEIDSSERTAAATADDGNVESCLLAVAGH